MPRPKKIKDALDKIFGSPEPQKVEKQEPTEKEKLLALYKELKDRGINSIGDLENQIARAG